MQQQMNSIDQINTTQGDLKKAGIDAYKAKQYDQVEQGEQVIIDDEGDLYIAEDTVTKPQEGELPEEYQVHTIRESDETALNSLTGNAATIEQVERALSGKESNVALTEEEGVQERHGQSYPTSEPQSVDESPTAGRYGIDKVLEE